MGKPMEIFINIHIMIIKCLKVNTVDIGETSCNLSKINEGVLNYFRETKSL